MRTLEDIPLLAHEREAIMAASALLRQRLPVKKVVLFGSKARGESREDSDIDLLVLTSGRRSWEEKQGVADLLYPIQLEYGVLFGTVEISEEDWYEGIYQAMPLRTEVERDGVSA